LASALRPIAKKIVEWIDEKIAEWIAIHSEVAAVAVTKYIGCSWQSWS
jgi:hypothetical protein